MTRIALSLAFLIAVAAPAAAQNGHVFGVLRDPSGAVLPGVDMRAVMTDANGETTRRVVTDGAGRYDIGSLDAGTWTVTASLPGFAAARRDIVMQAGQAVEWSPELRLGTLQETITITRSTVPSRTEAPRAAAPPAAAPARPLTAPSGAVRVGGNIKAPQKIVNVNPAYPADAAAQGVSGVVILECTIGPGGQVTEVKTLRSPNDSLTRAAADAVGGWEFTPTLLNGTPVGVVMTATFNFRLD
jgi:TonB family protein